MLILKIFQVNTFRKHDGQCDRVEWARASRTHAPHGALFCEHCEHTQETPRCVKTKNKESPSDILTSINQVSPEVCRANHSQSLSFHSCLECIPIIGYTLVRGTAKNKLKDPTGGKRVEMTLR